MLDGIIDKLWHLGGCIHRWWDGPHIRRVTITPPSDMFWSQELAREELIEAERGYPSKSLLEGAYFSYMCTLIP